MQLAKKSSALDSKGLSRTCIHQKRYYDKALQFVEMRTKFKYVSAQPYKTRADPDHLYEYLKLFWSKLGWG